MSWLNRILVTAASVSALALAAEARDFGRPATAEEIALWDIDVRPDGAGLPPGQGGVARGRSVYADNCEICHGAGGQGGVKDRLVGGQGTLASEKPVKTVGSFWPYATTLFDYIHRAMPYPAPESLSVDDTYAVTAYILNLNGLWPESEPLTQQALPKIKMPNRDGFLPDRVFEPDPNKAPKSE